MNEYEESAGMIKWHWELFDHWVVDENNHRIIFKPRGSGAHLVDVTLEGSDIKKIVTEIVDSYWTKEELIAYLDDMQSQ